jgi:hypothetical protein
VRTPFILDKQAAIAEEEEQEEVARQGLKAIAP